MFLQYLLHIFRFFFDFLQVYLKKKKNIYTYVKKKKELNKNQ